jgi:hypothetical protein
MSKPRSRRAAKPAKLAKRSERAQQRALLDQITSELVALKGKAGQALYHMGVRFARVRDEELWRAGGYASFDDYAIQGIDVSRATAYKLMRVAREFNAAIAERYGVEKLSLGLRYLEATPADERPGDLLASQIRLRDERGRWVAVPFHDATTREIQDAIVLLDDSREARRRVSADLDKRARRLADALPAAPAGISSGSRVRLRKTRDGRVAVTFAAIPLDEIEAFLKAVREHLT